MEFNANENSKQSNEEKIRLEYLIPLAVLGLFFVIFLGVIIYQRHIIKKLGMYAVSYSQSNIRTSVHWSVYYVTIGFKSQIFNFFKTRL